MNANPYLVLGVRPFINCCSVRTMHGGSLMLPQVRAARVEGAAKSTGDDPVVTATGLAGGQVLSAHAPIRDLGWIEGANIQIDTHWASADVGRLNRAAMELNDRKSDVILANGPLTVAALRPMTSKIPIVFTGVADPVGTGLVASLAQPGGNITGFTLGEFAMSGKLLGVLKQVAPQVSRITVIYYPQQVPQVYTVGIA